MIHPKDIHIEDYNYTLPDERIAKYPLAQRDASKLLVYRHGQIEEHHFRDLPDQIAPGSMVVFNDTRVIQARLRFRKPTGGRIEVFCLEPVEPRDYQQAFATTGSCVWSCLVGGSKKWHEGSLSLPVDLPDGRTVALCCERVGDAGPTQQVRFYWSTAPAQPGVNEPGSDAMGQPQDGPSAEHHGAVATDAARQASNERAARRDDVVSFAQLLEATGELPIPPYLNRATEEADKTTYQTVYSHVDGSVAAPTAGLHYTDDVLHRLRDRDVSLQYLTLHVGAGTFKPVKADTIGGHEMHTEFISVSRAVIVSLLAFWRGRRPGAMLVATGTTSVRTLESLYYIGVKLHRLGVGQWASLRADDLVVGQWEPYAADYDLPTADAVQRILDYLDYIGATHLVTSTQILIAPGFRYRLVEAMVTNFHMPQSTLLLLVSAFVDGASPDGPTWHRIYRYAMDHGFRFLSYGDSSLLMP